MTIEERYHKDPMFCHLVNMFYNAFKLGNLTPTEIREAMHMAMLKYELHHPRPTVIGAELYEQLNQRYRWGGTEKMGFVYDRSKEEEEKKKPPGEEPPNG